MKQMQHLTESQLQIQVFEWAQLMTGKYPELSLLYHIPNEGKRSIYYGAKLKREGLKSGVPDICLPIPKGSYCGLYIELKVGKNKPTKNQEYWLFSLSKAGHRTATKHYHIRKRVRGVLTIIGLTLKIFLASNKKLTFNTSDAKMKTLSILKRFWRGKRYEN